MLLYHHSTLPGDINALVEPFILSGLISDLFVDLNASVTDGVIAGCEAELDLNAERLLEVHKLPLIVGSGLGYASFTNMTDKLFDRLPEVVHAAFTKKPIISYTGADGIFNRGALNGTGLENDSDLRTKFFALTPKSCHLYRSDDVAYLVFEQTSVPFSILEKLGLTTKLMSARAALQTALVYLGSSALENLIFYLINDGALMSILRDKNSGFSAENYCYGYNISAQPSDGWVYSGVGRWPLCRLVVGEGEQPTYVVSLSDKRGYHMLLSSREMPLKKTNQFLAPYSSNLNIMRSLTYVQSIPLT